MEGFSIIADFRVPGFNLLRHVQQVQYLDMGGLSTASILIFLVLMSSVHHLVPLVAVSRLLPLRFWCFPLPQC
jgi:hypothetical protein